jgi:polysaccharide export outer membrane protein
MTLGIAIVMGLIMGGCASHAGNEGLMKPTPPASSDEGLMKQTPLAHQIEPGDLLEINVYENPDLSTEIRVPEDGYVPYPLLGNLKVAGLSVLELDSMITYDLGERYVKNPIVTVEVKEYRQRSIYVTGEVRRPGGYPYEIGMTVRKAISLAGGFTEKATQSKINLTRIVDGKEVTVPVSIDDVVQVEDIITVGRSFF